MSPISQPPPSDVSVLVDVFGGTAADTIVPSGPFDGGNELFEIDSEVQEGLKK